MSRIHGYEGPLPRCDGRYPVPQTSPPRDEPFEVTYRCGRAPGHEGPHGFDDTATDGGSLKGPSRLGASPQPDTGGEISRSPAVPSRVLREHPLTQEERDCREIAALKAQAGSAKPDS